MAHSKHSDSQAEGPRQSGSRHSSPKRSGSRGVTNQSSAEQGVAQQQRGTRSASAASLHDSSENLDGERQRLSPAWKWVISGLVLLHLLAVTAEPFRFFTRSARGTSPASDPLRWALAPYIELAYLNHGYFFFAPEPGPSHLMECRLQLPDSKEVSLTFPDKRKQWPRLLYHRHFMLAEFLHQLHVPPVDMVVVGEDPPLAQAWQAERDVFERVRNSMIQHVTTKFGASTARIERLEHRLPSDDEVFRQRLALDSPTLYMTLPDAPPALAPPAARLPSWGWRGMGVLLNPEAREAAHESPQNSPERPDTTGRSNSASGLPPGLKRSPLATEPVVDRPAAVGADAGEPEAIRLKAAAEEPL